MPSTPPCPPRCLRRRELTAALAAASLFGAGAAPRAHAQPAEPEAAPPPESFTSDTPLGKASDGQALTLADLPGRAVIVCFWASWCPYCRAEMAVLERIQQSVSAERLRVVLVNTEPTSDWRRVRRRLEGKLHGLMLHDPDGQVRKAFAAPNSVPYTVVVDRNGRSHATLRGWADDRLDWLLGYVNAALATPAS